MYLSKQGYIVIYCEYLNPVRRSHGVHDYNLSAILWSRFSRRLARDLVL